MAGQMEQSSVVFNGGVREEGQELNKVRLAFDKSNKVSVSNTDTVLCTLRMLLGDQCVCVCGCV